jgi:hypothetical protein
MEIAMGLPQAIQNQIDQADRIAAELSGGVPGENPETNASEPVQQPVLQPAEPIVQEQQAAPAVPEETWQVKFHTLKGKFDAEVPRLAAQAREQNSAIQTLLTENQGLKQRAATQPVQQAAPVTDADREAFGTDLVDMVDRVAAQRTQTLMEQIAQVRRDNEQLNSRLGNVNEQVVSSAKDRFTNSLTTAVPDWEAVNSNQGFLEWLGEVDPIYGMPRQAGLDNAYGKLDAGRTAAIFQAYKLAAGIVAPATTPSKELSRQIAPTRSRNTATPVANQANTRIWTNSDIEAFYKDLRLGNLGSEDAARIEAEINAAAAEGRVR